MSREQGLKPQRFVRTFAPLSIVGGFAIAMGSVGLLLPLLTIEAGYSAATVGILTTASAAVQLATRFSLPSLLARFTDRSVAMGSMLLMGLAAATVIPTPTMVTLVGAQALQGAARALFWTSTQHYAVRDGPTPTRRLAQNQMMAKLGLVLGPLLAGLLASNSLRGATIAAMITALLAAPAGLLMRPFAPESKAPRESRRGMWKRPEIAIGNLTAFIAGGWRGIADSFVPVLLSAAGQSPSVIGLLLALAESAAFVASALMSLLRNALTARMVRLAAASVLLGIGALPLVASTAWLASVATFTAGFGMGLATSLGPGLVNRFANQGEGATGIAVTGAYRSAARMAAPSAMAGLGPLMGHAAAMLTSGIALTAPVFILLQRVGPRLSTKADSQLEFGDSEVGGARPRR